MSASGTGSTAQRLLQWVSELPERMAAEIREREREGLAEGGPRPSAERVATFDYTVGIAAEWVAEQVAETLSAIGLASHTGTSPIAYIAPGDDPSELALWHAEAVRDVLLIRRRDITEEGWAWVRSQIEREWPTPLRTAGRWCRGCGIELATAKPHCQWHKGTREPCGVCGQECVHHDGPGYYLPPTPTLCESGDPANTCLTHGVGRDRACPACRRTGWPSAALDGPTPQGERMTTEIERVVNAMDDTHVATECPRDRGEDCQMCTFIAELNQHLPRPSPDDRTIPQLLSDILDALIAIADRLPADLPVPGAAGEEER